MILTKLKHFILIGALVAFGWSTPAYADLNPLEVTEADASPSTFPYKIIFTNGTVTDNGDGTASVTVTGGSGTPGGATGDVQTSDGVGGFAGESGLNFDGTTDTLTIGADGTDGILSFFADGASDFTTTFTPATQSANIAYTLPGNELVSGSVLTVTSSGTLHWEPDDAGGAGSGDIEGVTAGAGLTGGGTTGTVTLDVGAGTAIDVNANDVAWDSTEVASTTWGAGEASQVWTFNNSGTDTTLTMSSALGTFSHGVTVSGLLRADANLAIRNGASPSVLTMYEASGDGTNSVSFQPPALDSDTDYIFPTSENLVSGYVLTYTNNGTGVLTWEPDNTSTAAPGTKPPKEMWWTASALEPLEAADSIPPLSKFTGTNVDILTVSFDDGTDEGRKVSFPVPSDADTSGTVTFTFKWFSRTATTGNVIWDARNTVTGAEGESWDTSLTTEAAAADAVQGTTNLITVTTVTETFSNLGWAVGDQITSMPYRDANAAGDTMVGDAELIGYGVSIPRA